VRNMTVDGIDVDIIEGYVSVDALCKALNISAARQKEKCTKKYGTKRMKMPCYFQQGYRIMREQVVISETNVSDFVSSRGLWKNGPHNK